MRYIDVRSDLLHPGREVEVPQIQYEDQVVQVPIQKQAQFGERGAHFFCGAGDCKTACGCLSICNNTGCF